MAKLHRVNEYKYAFTCPGCQNWHIVTIKANPEDPGPVWTWNGDTDKPTFHPSILVQSTYGENQEKRVCHSYVRNGRIRFLHDCTHDLAGQTVELPEMDNHGKS